MSARGASAREYASAPLREGDALAGARLDVGIAFGRMWDSADPSHPTVTGQSS